MRKAERRAHPPMSSACCGRHEWGTRHPALPSLLPRERLRIGPPQLIEELRVLLLAALQL